MARTRTRAAAAAQPTLATEEGQAVAVRDTPRPPALQSADSLFAIIERASRDPNVDIEKMDRLLAMHARLNAGHAQTEYDAAMSAAQQEMKGIRANSSNPSTSSKYASYGALDKAIRPIYTKHGFALSFNTGDAPKENDVRILCTVSHRGGHRQPYHIDMPADGKGAKGGDVMTRTHATGAAVTYGKRYLADMIFNLATLRDNDGNDAADPAERAKAWTDAAIQELNAMNPPEKAALEKYRADNEKSIAWLKKNAPEEFERYQTAYSNAAQAAGISKEEPKRGGNKPKTSPADPAVADGSVREGGQQERPAAGGDPTSSSGQPAKVTDVVDQNAKKAEPIEFETFATTRPFLDFSSKWLGEAERTPEEARQWEAHYRASMAKLNAESKIPWVLEGLADLMVQYNLILAKEQAA